MRQCLAVRMSFKKCKNYVPVTVNNATKGDTVILSAGGRTYKQKIGYSTGSYYHTFYSYSTLGRYHSIKVKVKYEHKQPLYSYTWYLWR